MRSRCSGLILLTGFNGQISLGHGAFFAAGAYVAAILIDQQNWHYLLTLPVAGAVLFRARLSVRQAGACASKGHYLALATFALAVATPQILKYRHFERFTNGVQGINSDQAGSAVRPAAVARPVDVSGRAGGRRDHVLARAQPARQPHGPRHARDPRPAAGRRHHGHRQRPRRRRSRSAFQRLYVGVAGALHAIIFEFVSPDSFRFELSIAILVGAVVGGIASLPGALIGGVFVQVIEKYADALTKKLVATPCICRSSWSRGPSTASC